MKTRYFFLIALFFIGITACNNAKTSDVEASETHEHVHSKDCGHEHNKQESFTVEASDSTEVHECEGVHDHDHEHNEGTHNHKH